MDRAIKHLIRVSSENNRDFNKDLALIINDMKVLRIINGLKDLFQENRKNFLKRENQAKSKKTNFSGEVSLLPIPFLTNFIKRVAINDFERLKEFTSNLNILGIMVIEHLELSQNYIGKVAGFLSKLIEICEQSSFFFGMVRSKDTSKIEFSVISLDPRPITDIIFKDAYAVINSSGTVNEEFYCDVLGLYDFERKVKILKMSYPFPKKNVMVMLDKNLTSKFRERSKKMYNSYAETIKSVVINTPGNTGVFCPSYGMIEELKKTGIIKSIENSGKIVFLEEKGITALDNDGIIEDFFDESKKKGAVLIGVLGGRNSEGKDYSGDKMNSVILAGLPFAPPKPSLKAQINYYEYKFPKKGEAFGYYIPALDKSNQACGRPIRKKSDKGAIILLDYRYGNFKELLSDWIKEKIEVTDIESVDYGSRIYNFFKSGKKRKSPPPKVMMKKNERSKSKYKLIYILKLENEKWYVGGTNNLKNRLIAHRSGRRSPWTQMNKIITVEEVIEGGDLKTITLNYMRKYGWRNVRGYAWSQWNMKHPPRELR